MFARPMRVSSRVLRLLTATVLMLHGAAVATAQVADVTPQELENVTINEHLAAKLPLDATFLNASGEEVQLGRYFDGERPVILVPVYYSCPMLCGLTLNGVLDMAQQLEWDAGDQFRIVTFSFDARETDNLAKLKRRNMLDAYGRSIPSDGWTFLTSDEVQIRRLTEAIGFGFRWDERRQEYAHAACAVVCTPDGRVSQYMYGVQFNPKTARLLMVEASEGKIGSALDQFLLLCFHYDPEAGSYAWAAVNLMRVGAVATLLLLTALLVPAWIRRSGRRAQADLDAAATPTGADAVSEGPRHDSDDRPETAQ
jgi:protein SCO1/2